MGTWYGHTRESSGHVACGADVRMCCCRVESDFTRRPLHLRRPQRSKPCMRQKRVVLASGMCTPKLSSTLKPVMVPVSAISSGLAFRPRNVHCTGEKTRGGAGTHSAHRTHTGHGSRATRGRTRAHGSHRRTSQPAKPTDTQPARQRDDRRPRSALCRYVFRRTSVYRREGSILFIHKNTQ